MLVQAEDGYQKITEGIYEKEYRNSVGSLSHSCNRGRSDGDGKPNWTLVAHVGIIGHDRILVSMMKSHRSNIGIRQSGRLSVNIVDEALLPQADYTGCASGNKADKSGVFVYAVVNGTTPLIDASPVSMACEVVDNYETELFDNFICRIESTYAADGIVDGDGKIDYTRLHPVLFEMPTYQYLRTGEVIGPCMKQGRE